MNVNNVNNYDPHKMNVNNNTNSNTNRNNSHAMNVNNNENSEKYKVVQTFKMNTLVEPISEKHYPDFITLNDVDLVWGNDWRNHNETTIWLEASIRETFSLIDRNGKKFDWLKGSRIRFYKDRQADGTFTNRRAFLYYPGTQNYSIIPPRPYVPYEVSPENNLYAGGGSYKNKSRKRNNKRKNRKTRRV